MLRYLVELVYDPSATLLAFHSFQPVLERIGHGLRFALAGQGRESRCEFFRFCISDVQRHRSLHVENNPYCYSMPEKSASGKNKRDGAHNDRLGNLPSLVDYMRRVCRSGNAISPIDVPLTRMIHGRELDPCCGCFRDPLARYPGPEPTGSFMALRSKVCAACLPIRSSAFSMLRAAASTPCRIARECRRDNMSW